MKRVVMQSIAVVMLLLLPACGNAPSGAGTTTTATTTTTTTTTGTTTTTSTTTVTGSVGDGPVSGATLTFVDAAGTTLTVTDNYTNTSGTTATSDTNAAYTVKIPSTATFPVIVTATGGTDLARSQLGLTPTAPTMSMSSVIMDAYSSVAHVSPLTTLAVETAKVISGTSSFTATELKTAKQQVVTALGLGLDALNADFLTTATASMSTADMATILQASEAVGAMLARTQAATTGSTETSVVATLAKDVSDGALEGLQSGTALGTQEANNLQQVHAYIQQDLYTAHTVKLDATDIKGTTSTASLDASGLSTLATTIGVTLAATDPYAADGKLKVSSSAASNASPTSISMLSNASTGNTADGTASYTVTIQVKDGNTPSNPLPGQVVNLSWTTTSGGIVQITQTTTILVTDSNGTAQVAVTDLNSKDDTVKLSATVGALTTPAGSELSLSFTGTGSGTSGGGTTTTTTSNSISVTPSQATIGTVVSNGAALNPQPTTPYDLYTTPTAIDSYGTWASGTNTVQLQFLVRDASGVALSGQSVNFSVSGSQGGAPQISPSGMNTLSDGYATVTVTDITAEAVTVTATTGSVSASQAVTFFAMDPASIDLKNGTLTTAVIGISGSGSTSSGTLTFEVLDVNNNVVQGSHQVDFSIVGGGLNGGESLNSASATTLNGLASTVLSAGSKAGTVTVHAQLNATPSIGTDATMTITGGLPSGDALILSSSPLNIEGRKTLGLTQTTTALASDFFSNPVAPNVAVQFQTDAANISGSGTFAGTASSSATATLTSAAPQPTDGLVTIAAQTTGGIHSKVLSLAIVPNDANTIYAGTDGGGVFKTSDGGTSWTQVGAPLKTTTGTGKKRNLLGAIVRDLVIDPYNANTIYAATERGVFVSVNAGNDWTTLTGLRRVSGDILGTISTATGSKAADGRWKDTALTDSYTYSFNFQYNGVRSRAHIYVNGVETTSYRISGNGIQFIGDFSKDANGVSLNGKSVTADYDTASGIASSYPFYAVAVDSNSYDATKGHSNTIYVGTFGDGVWKTTDGGNTWAKASAMATAGVSFGLNVLSLAIGDNVGAHNDIYAGTNSNGLFGSNDAAVSWNKLTGTTAKPIGESTVQSVLFNGGKIWIGGRNGIHYSTDSGTTWNTPTSNVNAGDATNLDVRALARDPVNGTLYAATFGDVLQQSDPYGGVYTSSDDGVTWNKLSPVSTVAGAHKLDSIDVYGQAGNDIVVVGSEGRLISKSADSGGSWTALPGTAPSNLTNTLFTTMQVMHSGGTYAYLQPLRMTYQPQNDGSTPGYGSSTTIYNGESHSFYLHVADDLGNKLVAGSTITATVSAGLLSGDSSVTLGDGVFGGGDYVLTWTNNLSTVNSTDAVANLTVNIGSNNGNRSLTATRTLVNPVNGPAVSVIDTYSQGASDLYSQVTVSAAGGSNGKNGYTFTSPKATCSPQNPASVACNNRTATTQASVSSALFQYTKPTAVSTVTDTVTVKDLVTNQSANISVTITYQSP